MGYPMTFQRVIRRNNLQGDYDSREPLLCGPLPSNRAIAGDLRRLERDSCDEVHLAAYARVAGITTDQAARRGKP